MASAKREGFVREAADTTTEIDEHGARGAGTALQ